MKQVSFEQNFSNILTKQKLRFLIEIKENICLSGFMPTHQKSIDAKQDLIRYKNLLQEMSKKLEKIHLSSKEINGLLDPMEKLSHNSIFWRNQSTGLAIFRTHNIFYTYVLPITFEEITRVDDHFYVKPLFPLFSHEGSFYVLGLEREQIRLFQGTSSNIHEIYTFNIPPEIKKEIKDPYQNIEAGFEYKDIPKPINPDIIKAPKPYTIVAEKIITDYFRQIDKTLYSLLKEDKSPLLLAGKNYDLLQLYGNINTYPNIMQGKISSSENTGLEELHQEAWILLKTYFEEQQRKAKERYHILKGTGYTSTDLNEIIFASHEGRVDVLFTNLEKKLWGHIDKTKGIIELIGNMEPFAEDLFDSASIHTFLHRGEVYALEKKQMPDTEAIAAIFRY